MNSVRNYLDESRLETFNEFLNRLPKKCLDELPKEISEKKTRNNYRRELLKKFAENW